ncbi:MULTISPECIES: TIM barrel protein [unclassified Thermosipho (in: thermotogales)]|uniref:TIM barrel protein n=1 Tax=unclassified Thermosipho (in: thermotogales) TaxID=2676525 RepID=UPI000949336A|nr:MULTISPECIES: TIM barrel protein [unclassified Thermosipho (in: thermotogales)]ANQ54458.1 xylose isomerase [Thermosipho sp. 1070]OOC42342.1 xylose isomerase [Thermosipho sp. 1074]
MKIGVSTSVIRSDFRFLKYFLEKFEDLDFYELGFLSPLFVNNLFNLKKSFGIHAPFIFKMDFHPKLTCNDYHETFRKIRQSAFMAKYLSAKYLIVHYPDTLQLQDWKDNFKLLDELKGIIKIRIENTFGNKYFYAAKDYKFLCEELGLTMCIDIGHLLLDERINPFDFIEELSDFVEEFHVYYADDKTYKKCHHLPWSDNEKYINLLNFIKEFDVDIVIEATPDCKGLDRLLNFWR